MEICIGDFIRTKRGYFGKVIKIRERIKTYKNDREAYLVDWSHKRATYISQIKDIKHSNNIIDLIQEGDYVNGGLITAIYDEYKNDDCIKFETNYEGKYRVYVDEDIKSLVTREQFSSVEYLLEEE